MQHKKMLYTIKEAAEIFGVHPETVRRWIREDSAPPKVKIQGKTFFRAETLDRWLTEQEH